MATKLDKDIIRESTLQVDGREIMVTLSATQEIKFKLKGMKSGELSIGVDKLYSQLSGNDDLLDEVLEKKSGLVSVKREDKIDKDSPMISLHDLRSLSAVSAFDLNTTIKFDGLIAELIKNDKERKKVLKKK